MPGEMRRVREILEGMVASFFSGCSLAAQGNWGTVELEPEEQLIQADADAPEYARAVA